MSRNGRLEIGKALPRALALAVAACLLAAGTAYALPAVPSAIGVTADPASSSFKDRLSTKQFRFEQLKIQLDALDLELATSVEAYNLASQELSATQLQLATARTDLANANAALEQQRDLLETRVVEIYLSGEYGDANVLLTSKSLADFLARAQGLSEISSADADLALQLANQRDQISARTSELASREVEASALEFTLRARKIEIEARIADRRAMLAQAEQDIAKMLAAEEARTARIEASLWRRVLLGASRTGVKVQAGGPVETILAYHGIPYVWAGDAPSGFDCSGLTMYVMRQHGVELPHHAASQYQLGQRVSKRALKPGDLVFFGSPVHHVGMYIGGGYFVHAPRTGDFVKVSRLRQRGDYVGARRYDWAPRLGDPVGVSSPKLPSDLPVGR